MDMIKAIRVSELVIAIKKLTQEKIKLKNTIAENTSLPLDYRTTLLNEIDIVFTQAIKDIEEEIKEM